jgi:hypothetical protein
MMVRLAMTRRMADFLVSACPEAAGIHFFGFLNVVSK